MWNRHRCMLSVLPLALVLTGCGGDEVDSRGLDVEAPPGAGEPALRSELLVDGEWLAAHLGDPELVILHVGADEEAYRSSHLPGARFVPISALNRERDGIPNMLPERAELARTFSEAGVTMDSRVVVYGAPLQAARAFVALEHLGHRRVALLDGGQAAWRGGAALETREGNGRMDGELTPAASAVIVDAGWVADRLDDPETTLIDARPRAQYTGDEAGDRVPRPGHIPGARNLFWEELIVSTDEPRLKDEPSLRALFRERGAAPGVTVVTYCRTGMQASFAYFVARYLGYDTRMYDGSFVDWSPRTELPVERGAGTEG